MATAFLSTYKKAFIPYAFTQEEMALNGAKRSYQRFEQCLQLLGTIAAPAMKALESQKLFDVRIQKSAALLATETIRDYRHEIISKVKNYTIRTKILEKIDSIKLVVMFPDDILKISKIVKIYQNLELEGTEPFVKMYAELSLFASSIEREPKHSWITNLTEILRMDLKLYNANMNLICKNVKVQL